ncbi:MAG: hypothetical protein WCO56_18505 [Verrucomicrobiota bacterium]
MNQELQQRLLAALARPGLAWKTSLNHEIHEQASLQWLPIANVTTANIELGIASDACWLRATSHSVTRFSEGKPCVFLLPVLEVEIHELVRLFEYNLQKKGLSTEFVKTFPFEEVVSTGLESHSEHWTALALKWAEQLPPSSKLQASLSVLASNGPTQKIRQAGQKLLAQQQKPRAS